MSWELEVITRETSQTIEGRDVPLISDHVVDNKAAINHTTASKPLKAKRDLEGHIE